MLPQKEPVWRSRQLHMGHMRMTETPTKGNGQNTHSSAAVLMRCSVLCWHLTLVTSWPVAALRMRHKGDPLQSWRQNEGRFKLLAKQARKFLCAPSSSVPSEHVFSEVSAIYEGERGTLNNSAFCTAIWRCSIGTTN